MKDFKVFFEDSRKMKEIKDETIQLVVTSPPYAYRKAMELYKGNYVSRFKLLADLIPSILNIGGRVISFGYHSTFLSKKRNAVLTNLCVFAHGGAQHSTIGIIEVLCVEGEK